MSSIKSHMEQLSDELRAWESIGDITLDEPSDASTVSQENIYDRSSEEHTGTPETSILPSDTGADGKSLFDSYKSKYVFEDMVDHFKQVIDAEKEAATMSSELLTRFEKVLFFVEDVDKEIPKQAEDEYLSGGCDTPRSDGRRGIYKLSMDALEQQLDQIKAQSPEYITEEQWYTYYAMWMNLSIQLEQERYESMPDEVLQGLIDGVVEGESSEMSYGEFLTPRYAKEALEIKRLKRMTDEELQELDDKHRKAEHRKARVHFKDNIQAELWREYAENEGKRSSRCIVS